jgi:hypothetical protein
MNIGFEAKKSFHNKTGLGNYSRDLIRILSQYSANNKYFHTIKQSRRICSTKEEGNVFEKTTNPFTLSFITCGGKRYSN